MFTMSDVHDSLNDRDDLDTMAVLYDLDTVMSNDVCEIRDGLWWLEKYVGFLMTLMTMTSLMFVISENGKLDKISTGKKS